MSPKTFLIILLLTNLVMFNSAYRLNQHYHQDEYYVPALNQELPDPNDCFPFCLVQSSSPIIQQPSRRDTYFLRFGRKR